MLKKKGTPCAFRGHPLRKKISGSGADKGACHENGTDAPHGVVCGTKL